MQVRVALGLGYVGSRLTLAPDGFETLVSLFAGTLNISQLRDLSLETSLRLWNFAHVEDTVCLDGSGFEKVMFTQCLPSPDLAIPPLTPFMIPNLSFPIMMGPPPAGVTFILVVFVVCFQPDRCFQMWSSFTEKGQFLLRFSGPVLLPVIPFSAVLIQAY